MRTIRHLADNHYRGDALLRVRPVPSPYLSVLMCAIRRCNLGRAFSVTSNSRMMYAFSRDGAIPGSKFLNKVDRRWRSPIRAGSSFHDSRPNQGQQKR